MGKKRNRVREKRVSVLCLADHIFALPSFQRNALDAVAAQNPAEIFIKHAKKKQLGWSRLEKRKKYILFAYTHVVQWNSARGLHFFLPRQNFCGGSGAVPKSDSNQSSSRFGHETTR